jgi:hypothetical protein
MSDIETIDTVNQVELDWYDESDEVRVTPRDQVRFNIQKDRAIDILQQANKSDLVREQFTLLLSRLAEWLRGRQGKISNAILTLQENSLAFVVVRRQAKYDEQFQDELADLDFAIANDPDLEQVALKTLALPHVTGDSLRSFLDTRLVFSFPHHGERTGPHQPGKS